MTTEQIPELDNFFATIQDPYPMYSYLQEHEPVHWNPMFNCFMLTKYDDVNMVFLDAKRFSSDIWADSTKIPAAVEELLRYVSPVHTLGRDTTQDVTIRGVTIPKDTSVYILVGAANRDPEKFSHPDKLDINRTNLRSLGFGYGIHFCIGATLARMEGQIMFETILRRLANIQLDEGTPEFRPNYALRGLVALPITFDAASG